jgi:septal ring factor EnvC (AmiA/AmiB activator)
VSSDLAAETETSAQLQSDVNQAEKDKAKAQESAAQANNETDKAKAETDKAKAETDKAKAEADAATSCAQGAVNAFGAIFEGDNLRDGVDQAVARLQELKGTCKGPLSGG